VIGEEVFLRHDEIPERRLQCRQARLLADQ
jgi:hypothetical protein